MQLFPVDVLGIVFSFIPEEIPRIGQVCKRFRAIVDTENFWGLRLRRRFKISEVPEGVTFKGYYKLCFWAQVKFKQPIANDSASLNESAKPIAGGFVAKINYRIDPDHTLEMEHNVIRLRDKLNNIIKCHVLKISTYTLDRVQDGLWRAASPHATYILDVKTWTCHLVIEQEASLFIRDIYLFAVTAAELFAYDKRNNERLFQRTILHNNKLQIYHLREGEIAFITDRNELILVHQDIRYFTLDRHIEPEERLNDSQLIVKCDRVSHIFDLPSCRLLPLNLGNYSFRTAERAAFCLNGNMDIYDLPELKQCHSYMLKREYQIVCLSAFFVMLKPQNPQAGDGFYFLNIKDKDEHEFARASPLTYIGLEAFFVIFARLNDITLEIISYNPLTKEIGPNRLINCYHFRSATRITNAWDGLMGSYLVVTYQAYKIQVKAVLAAKNNEYKIITNDYKY